VKEMEENIFRFVGMLKRLNNPDNPNRGALAMLRRGLGRPLGEVADMYPIIVPYLPDKIYRKEEKMFYLIGALFAWHPSNTEKGNFGDSLKILAAARGESESLERRFISLLNCHTDDLPDHIRQHVGLQKSGDIPINWTQLFKDILKWDHPDKFVQKKWAKSFWAKENPEKNEKKGEK
jgi:CRISPR system Cascade subunit CasB